MQPSGPEGVKHVAVGPEALAGKSNPVAPLVGSRGGSCCLACCEGASDCRLLTPELWLEPWHHTHHPPGVGRPNLPFPVPETPVS